MKSRHQRKVMAKGMGAQKGAKSIATVNHGKRKDYCHMCKSKEIFKVLDLGSHPLSDTFLMPHQLDEPEVMYPLRLFSCKGCGLLQIDYFVDPRILYQVDYLYESSTTATGRAHYRAMALHICDKLQIKNDSLAVDIGSNVGVLLQGFLEAGMQVLGVDPSANASKKAISSGIDTIVDFFTLGVVKKIKSQYGKASIITATNVFAHLQEIDDAVKAMKYLVDKDGAIIIEAPYAIDFIEQVEYDTIYHQHILYLSVKPMVAYFKKFGLELFDVEKVSIHGGSLRYFVGHKGRHAVSDMVRKFIKSEEAYGLYTKKVLDIFGDKVKRQRSALLELLLDLKKKGKSIAGVSAPAKGNTLLNYCNLNPMLLDFITEKTHAKIGRYTPGTRIPIFDDAHLLKKQPDYALILAWNFSDEIMNNLKEFKKRGGKFIIPIPYPKII